MSVFPWRGLGRWALFLAVVVCFAASGCGPSTGSVSGKVYYKDTLLKGGRVQFITADQKGAMAEIGEDGSYTLDKLALGEAKIAVETDYLKVQGSRPSYGPPKGGSNAGGYTPPDPKEAAKRYTAIPSKYEDPATSGKTFTVKPGKQEFDIKLD